MVLNKDSKRIAIYFIYDKDGIIDDYIIYQLVDLKKNVQYLLVVINGELSVEGRKKLTPLADDILVRKNEGFDVWAYKEGMEALGWETLAEYDELLLMNFTCFGPLYPFSETFLAMNPRDIDFWGMTKYYRVDFDPFGCIEYGYIPEHIQSYFMCIRKSLFRDRYFKEYWQKMPMIKSFYEAIGKHEAVFTKKMETAGFKSDVYIRLDASIQEISPYPLMFLTKELIEKYRCPLIKRKGFFDNYQNIFGWSSGEAAIEFYTYLKNHFQYDINMIWDNILRTSNMFDIKMNMHLNYILPRDILLPRTGERHSKIALLFHFYYTDLADETMRYINNMPLDADIFIMTDTEAKKMIIETELKKTGCRYKIRIIENRGRDMSALLVGARDVIFNYDIVCFAHDKKVLQLKPYSIGKSFAYKCLQNTLGSKTFIENIITTFEAEPRLGMLMPPPPNHAVFLEHIGWEWTTNFENAKTLLEELNINIPVDEKKAPVSALGMMFWFRPAALKPLYVKVWNYEDFPEEPIKIDTTILHALERIYGFASQAAGYYNGHLMHDRFAALELTNWNYITRELKARIEDNEELKERYERSFSWRITAPLRLIKRIAKKIIPKPIWRCLRRLRSRA